MYNEIKQRQKAKVYVILSFCESTNSSILRARYPLFDPDT